MKRLLLTVTLTALVTAGAASAHAILLQTPPANHAILTRSPAAIRVTARQFSTVALVGVGVLAASGVGRSLSELNSVSQLWSTFHGQTLLTDLRPGSKVPSALTPVLHRTVDSGSYSRVEGPAAGSTASR